MQLSSSSISSLATILAPPPEPQHETPFVTMAAFFFGFISVLGSGICLMWFTTPGMHEMAQGLAVMSGLSWILTIVCATMSPAATAAATAGFAVQNERWHSIMVKYARLVVCARCGHVTDPEVSRSEPIDSAGQLLKTA